MMQDSLLQVPLPEEKSGDPHVLSPADIGNFAMCHGAVDGLVANIETTIAGAVDTVPDAVSETQAKLGRLAWLFDVLTRKAIMEDSGYWSVQSTTDNYIEAERAHRYRPQSVTTITAYVRDSLDKLDEPCEEMVERVTMRYFPDGYPRQID
ncbi:hypothetical protein [Alterisphingorhabdus coralli]|uniref:Uncharacterized protein n=1 Tax=Alterisphingorhabdus coralli TaxID=3071408 RepID=A0AA97F899_9SPHN|nr:hypothetical protein [Parasphingorhabdus sp. SCSIO 66989]WOE75112.1 hypothetical protein RB602_14975 [Parasphingorhabdus sp. SCSIO 66989]